MYNYTVSAPVISITEHPIPYNGTVFTLSGVSSIDPSVDTDVTAEGVWSAVADDVGTPLQISIRHSFLKTVAALSITSWCNVSRKI